MIISHKHKYIFVQLPHTASTSIGRELVENYDGERILYKHSRYDDFLKIASKQEKQYFSFSCIRNPLDIIVTKYLKYKNVAGGGENYDNPKTWKRNGGWVSDYELRIFRFIQKKANFPDFFTQFYPLTYDNWSSVGHHMLDFVIRYETLDSDFSQVLQFLKLDQKRQLPVVFSTPGKTVNLDQYYIPKLRPRAIAIVGPFMRKWNYAFPSSWTVSTIPWYRELEYKLLSPPRRFYWIYLQKHQGCQMPRWFERTPSRFTPWSRAQPN